MPNMLNCVAKDKTIRVATYAINLAEKHQNTKKACTYSLNRNYFTQNLNQLSFSLCVLKHMIDQQEDLKILSGSTKITMKKILILVIY